MVNNLRDIESDAAAGKRTLAVIIGDTRSRVAYCWCVLTPFVVPLARGSLIQALGQTGRLHLGSGFLFTIAVAVRF